MTHDQIKLACDMAKIGAWALNLDTGEVDFEGDEHILRGVSAAFMDARYPTIHPDDAKAMQNKLSKINEQSPFYDHEYRAQTPQGWRWFRVKGKLQLGTRVLYGVSMDVTDQKSAEAIYEVQMETVKATKASIRELLNNLKTT